MYLIGVVFVGLIFVFGNSSQSRANDTDFDKELGYLRQQTLQTVGRDSLTVGYERFIQDNIGNPRVAEAMLDLASSFGNTIPSERIHVDYKAASDWIKKAAETASVGSETWMKAQFLVASSFENPGESRRILNRIAGECNSNLAILVKIEYFLILASLKEGDLEEAEEHALTIMNWYADPKNVPSDNSDKRSIDTHRRNAGGTIMDAWTTAPWPLAERERKVREFMQRYAWGEGLSASGEIALKHIRLSHGRIQKE